MRVRVSNLCSPSSGREIANQFEIEVGNKTYFQSYRTVIAVRGGDKITLDRDAWNYSVTTSKYRNVFLAEDRKTTERKIKNGTYKLRNLNK